MATTLHMEVPTARQVQKRLQDVHQNLMQLVQQAQTSVSQLEAGAWQGQSAQEFYSRFQTWRQNAMRVLEELQQMAMALNNEINQWEQMARKLG